jgi:hypothetical protein
MLRIKSRDYAQRYSAARNETKAAVQLAKELAKERGVSKDKLAGTGGGGGGGSGGWSSSRGASRAASGGASAAPPTMSRRVEHPSGGSTSGGMTQTRSSPLSTRGRRGGGGSAGERDEAGGGATRDSSGLEQALHWDLHVLGRMARAGDEASTVAARLATAAAREHRPTTAHGGAWVSAGMGVKGAATHASGHHAAHDGRAEHAAADPTVARG